LALNRNFIKFSINYSKKCSFLFTLKDETVGKVKFWSKKAIEANRAKFFFQIISGYMNLNFKQKR
jgi:hypothetical protein